MSVTTTTTADGTTITLADNGILNPAQFRALIPAFNDSSIYTDEALNLDLTMAANMVGPRWYNLRPMGMALFVAHFLSLDERENRVARRGGVPGQGAIGVLSSKSIGSVSAGYDTSSGSEDGAGQWNMTSYGRRYIHFAKLVGMGGVQITGGLLQGNTKEHGPVF